MFHFRTMHIAGALALVLAPLAPATQSDAVAGNDAPDFQAAAAKILADLDAAQAELNAVREEAREERLPLNERLTELRRELLDAEQELQTVKRSYDDSALKLSNLTKRIEDREAEATYLSNLFTDYGRNLESRLHIAELQRYGDELASARLAPENTNLSQAEVYAEQVALLELSIERLFELGGGTRFEGTAVDETGLVRDGRFLVVGPTALFRSNDGAAVGTAESRLGSVEPTVQTFVEPEDAAAASDLVETGAGELPFDPSLGNAHKIAATRETFIEHIQKGGVIMYPILGMAAVALIVALYKWLAFLFVRKPTRKSIDGLMEAIRAGDEESARRRANEIKGPVGTMLQAGIDTMRRSRDLMEEVMYEKVLVAKTRLNKALPFIAVCAASAPLLGLLGTVTGIINTFKQITLFGSGDVKQLSGGISEALITTKFGLIVAIPSLLLHAYLARRARGLVTQMETNAVRFANEVSRSDAFGERVVGGGRAPNLMPPDHEFVRGQVTQVLTDMLGPLSNEPASASRGPASS